MASTPIFVFSASVSSVSNALSFVDDVMCGYIKTTAAVQACCSRLPGIFPLAQKIGEYKNKLDSLTPAEEVCCTPREPHAY